MVTSKDENGELKTWKIFIDGRVEGFGENCRICNFFTPIFFKLHNYFLLEKKS